MEIERIKMRLGSMERRIRHHSLTILVTKMETASRVIKMVGLSGMIAENDLGMEVTIITTTIIMITIMIRETVDSWTSGIDVIVAEATRVRWEGMGHPTWEEAAITNESVIDPDAAGVDLGTVMGVKTMLEVVVVAAITMLKEKWVPQTKRDVDEIDGKIATTTLLATIMVQIRQMEAGMGEITIASAN